MFEIYNDYTEFTQWESGHRLTEPSLIAGDKVVFLNSRGKTYTMEAYGYGSGVMVDVPNELLTMAQPIVVYISGKNNTRTTFPVVAQEKPADYVFVDNDDWRSGDDVVGIVDLTKFTLDDGYTVNDKLVTMMMTSIESNGTLQVYEGIDANLAFRKALSAEKQIAIVSDLEGTNVRFAPTVASKYGTANMVSINAVAYMQGIIVDMYFIIVYENWPTNKGLTIYVKTTPIAQG